MALAMPAIVPAPASGDPGDTAGTTAVSPRKQKSEGFTSLAVRRTLFTDQVRALGVAGYRRRVTDTHGVSQTFDHIKK